MRSLKIALAAPVFVAALFLSGCGGGGGGGDSPLTTVPAAQMPSTTAPNVSEVVQPAISASAPGSEVAETPPVPPPMKVTLGTKSFGGQRQVAIQNAIAAPSEAASAPVLPTTSAGKVSATPVNQVISLNKTEDGMYFGGSDEGGTYLMNPADVDKICASSAQLGYAFLPGQSSRACAAPDLITDTVTLPKTCSRDSVLYTWHMKDGSIRWLDWTSDRKFTISSDSVLPGVVQTDGAHVVWNGYAGATVKVIKTSADKASVTIDFGSNCVGSFGQMNDVAGTSGRLVDMSVVDGSTWLRFLFHSDKSGADGGSGWGSQPWLDVTSGYTVQPSVIDGYLNFDVATGNYFVTIANVPCSNTGNITAYRGTKQVDGSYLYDPAITGTDDPLKRPFGLGWLPIQGDSTEDQLYTLVSDPSVSASFDRTKFNLVIGSCN